jgi:hypothetical protein
MKARTVKFAVAIALAIVFSIFVLVLTGGPLDLKSEVVVVVVAWLVVDAVTRLARAIVHATGKRRTTLLIVVGAATLFLVAVPVAWFRSVSGPAGLPSPSPEIESPASRPIPLPPSSLPPSSLPPSSLPPPILSPPMPAPIPSRPPHGRFSAARSLLIRDEYEERGFGLYSYLLFGSRPTADTKNRYLELVRTIIQRAERTTDMTAVGYPKSELNVFYFPVMRKPRRTATVDETAEWIVAYYDYARARRILDLIDLPMHGDGPYLLASLLPLSRGIVSNVAIMEDLTFATDATAPLWARRFVDVSCTPQLWNQRSLSFAALRIRDLVSLAAVASQPVVRAVDVIVAWVKPKKSGIP